MLAFALVGCTGLGGEPDIVATVARSAAAPATKSSNWRPNLENGARVFAERCTECHGATGDGLGQLVLAGSVSQPLDMTDRAAVSLKSPLEWFEIISEGRIDKLMPPWKDALTEKERWDVAHYGYSLSYDADLLAEGEAVWRQMCAACDLPEVIAPVFSDAEYGAQLNAERFDGALSADESAAAVAYLRLKSLEAPPESDDSPAQVPLGSISGRVVNGTARGAVPSDTVVQLQYGNAELGFSRAVTQVDADFRFRFEEVPQSDALIHAVSVEYEGRLFSRRLQAGSASDVTIELYDLSQDPAVLRVSRIDLYIDAVELPDLGRGLYVSQVIGFFNASDRIFTSGRGFDDGREAVLLIPFPAGSRIMSGDDMGRYILVEDVENIPDSIIDTRPVPPGDAHQVIIEYFLPFTDEASIEQSFNYLIDADLTVTLEQGLVVENDWLHQEDAGGAEPYQLYSGRLRLDSEPRLSLVINGDPFATTSDDESVVTQENLPLLLAGAGAIAAALFAAIGLTRRRLAGHSGDMDKLVAELARLDEDHDQGRINHDLYHHKRRELKARLAELMADGE